MSLVSLCSWIRSGSSLIHYICISAIICAAVLVLVFCASDEVNNIQQRPIRLHKISPGGGSVSDLSLIGSDYIPSDPYAITDFSTGYYLILLAAFLSLLAVGITLIDCACYHTVFASSRHSTRGYERLVAAPSTVSVVPEQPGAASVSSSRRAIFAVPVSSRAAASSFVTVAENPSVSNNLLPPPPPYSATLGQSPTNANTAQTASPSLNPALSPVIEVNSS